MFGGHTIGISRGTITRWGIGSALLTLLAGCEADPPAVPSLTPNSPSAEPAAGETLQTFGPDLEPAEIPPEDLVPEDASVTGRWFGFTDDGIGVLVAWVEPGSDVFRLPRGFSFWERFPSMPHWRAVLVQHHDANEGTQEIQISTTDLTGDRSDEALVFEGVGGSGACGSWLVIDLLRAKETFARHLCDGRIDPGPPESPGLVITESMFRPDDAHCCPSAFRETTLAWIGKAWRVTDTQVTET